MYRIKCALLVMASKNKCMVRTKILNSTDIYLASIILDIVTNTQNVCPYEAYILKRGVTYTIK